MIDSFTDKGKSVERRRRKTTGLRHYAMVAGLPKEGRRQLSLSFLSGRTGLLFWWLVVTAPITESDDIELWPLQKSWL